MYDGNRPLSHVPHRHIGNTPSVLAKAFDQESKKKGKTHTHTPAFIFVSSVTLRAFATQSKINKIKKTFRRWRYAHRLGERSTERVPEKRQLCATEKGEVKNPFLKRQHGEGSIRSVLHNGCIILV